MSIRQMSFEEGQALNIRECPKLAPKDSTLDELRRLSADETIKIVKSGKSYFDVTNRPKIFESAHDDFSFEELTKIDQRDLRKTEVAPAFPEEAADNDPMSLLFKNTSQEEVDAEEWDRKTYYLRFDQTEAFSEICFKEGRDVSGLVRELLDIGIAAKSQEYGIDFRAEAEKRLLANPKRTKRKYKKRR